MKSIEAVIEQDFSEKRRIHTLGVVETAKKLAKLYNVDVDKAVTASLYHDLFRGKPVNVINYYVNHLGFDSKYLDNPNLAHGKIAAYIMKQEYGIEDQEILDAVSYHTTGRAGMSDLEKVVFLADTIEPNRKYPGVDQLRELAVKDLNKACLLSLERTIQFVTSKGEYLDPDTIDARDSLLKEI